MGQYHFICNLDKREFLHPHRFGDGLKLLEFGSSACGTLTGLTFLLTEQTGRGGGDFRLELDPDPPCVTCAKREIDLVKHYSGRWAGDRLAIIGDYWDSTDAIASTGNPWQEDSDDWTDISDDVVGALRHDSYLAKVLDERLSE